MYMETEEYKLLIENKEITSECLERAKRWLINPPKMNIDFNKNKAMFEKFLDEANNEIKDYEVRHSIISPDTVEEPGPSGVVYEIQEINEPGPNNKLEFEGIFKGKESEIRITPDKRISVFDFIRVVGGQKNPRYTWGKIIKKYKNEVVGFYDNLKFAGSGQKLTPVINVQGMVKMLFWLPGEMAKQFRTKSAEKLIEYLGGNPSLINEVSDEIQEINEPGPSGIVSNFDYSSLVQNSNETTGFKSDLLQELNNEFNTEEQSIFVNSFYSYLNHHPTEDYIIDLSDVYEWIGFTTIGNAKRVLVKKFREGTDYQTLLINSDKQKLENRGGSNKEKIMMNVETFKGLCMVSGTDKASKIRGYFLKLESIVMKVINNTRQIQPVQKQSNFNQDQINNSKRLLEYFGDKKNVIYNLIFNHKDFGWLSKIGIVRELRGFHERFKEHQEAFGEVCIHSVIQCTNIEQVERDFKDTSLFQTNKVKVPKNGDGNYTEIMKLTELNTMETISNEIKRIANDRILDPPPMYSQQQLTENTHVNSLEIEKEKTRQIESQSDKEIRLAQIQADKEIKLADLETKKLEFEMLKFKVANNIPIT